MTPTASISFSVWVEEHYQSLPRLIPKVCTQPEPEPALPPVPILKLTVVVQELYQELQALDPDPQLDLQLQETEAQRIAREQEEMRALIWLLRQQHSLTCHQNSFKLSSKASRETHSCRTCKVSMTGTQRIVVGKHVIESAGERIAITLSWPSDPKDWWYLCSHCNLVEQDELLHFRYQGWLELLKKATKDYGPIKKEAVLPTFQMWKSAYTEDMKNQDKRSSSLLQLASTMDEYRTDSQTHHGKSERTAQSNTIFPGPKA